MPPSEATFAAPLRHVYRPLPHDSGAKHVQGCADYVDDIPEPAGTLHVAVGGSTAARGTIRTLDLSEAAKAPDVIAIITAADVPAKNDISPSAGDEPVFAEKDVIFHNQPIFAVVARTRDAARRAVRLAHIEVNAEKPNVTVEQGRAAGETVMADYGFIGGNAGKVIAEAPMRSAGSIRIGGQEHFYLEGQIALAVPGEDGSMLVHSSTQHPSEIQHIVARVLGLPDSFITCQVRRMGGGFGGKETQATQWAVIAAVAARKTGRPCKLRLDRDDDMLMTGKRHDFKTDYAVGYDSGGRIRAVDIDISARCGCSADLSIGVIDRAMFHSDNAYFLPEFRIYSRRVKTNTVSNTAFRGFGGPQGMLAIERVIDVIAWKLRVDPLDVRKINLYGAGRDITPYGQTVEDHDTAIRLIEQLEGSSNYRERRGEIAEFNARSPILKRGIALTPVKFGISFTLATLNQAGALVHVYQDGSLHLNHGGTEMGQGLLQKVAQVAAEELGIGLERVRITATSTDKVPNTSATAASAGTDLNGMAVQRAVKQIKMRLTEFASEKWNIDADRIEFRDDCVLIGNETIPFGELTKQAHAARVHLSAAGFYKTPKLHWDRDKANGRPFFYYAYGAACSEVVIDILTGEMRVKRIDVLHDVGRSINPAIDIGQVEGGFVQGMGWLTTEELVYDEQGCLLTHAPSTYKIPVAGDVPEDFRVALFDGSNREETIYRSKAVGEPPLMLAISVFAAIADAIHSLNPGKPVELDAPATPEAILKAIGPIDAVAALAEHPEHVNA
jgi:xanthine dehydrogenase large subunit